MLVDTSLLQRSNALSHIRTLLSGYLVKGNKLLTKRTSSVFVPICYKEDKLCLLYTKRAETLRSHTGQIRCNEGENAEQTSVREMEEEIGVNPVEVWGCLPAPIISLKLENVYGCVGYIGHIEDLTFRISEQEVATYFAMPIESLVHSRGQKSYTNQRSRQQWEMLAKRMKQEDGKNHMIRNIEAISNISTYVMPIFPSALENDPIWGLTALMTDRLLYVIFKEYGYKKHSFI